MKKIYILLITFLMFSSPALAMEAKLVEKETRYGTISYPQISGIADKNIEASLNTMIREEADTWNCDFDGERTDEEIKRMSYDAWSVIHTGSAPQSSGRNCAFQHTRLDKHCHSNNPYAPHNSAPHRSQYE